MSDFQFDPAVFAELKWNARGSCGNPGCKDPLCACSLCGEPIGTPEEEQQHNHICDSCEDCDDVPTILWGTQGQVQLHHACFMKLLGAQKVSAPA